MTPDRHTARIDQADTLEREGRALELKTTKGMTWEQIAQELGYANASGAWKAARRALTRYPAAKAEEYRQVQNAQLDALEAQTWHVYQQALDEGDLELALKAQDRLQKWLDRRAKLNGMDAPVKSEVEHKGGTFQVSVPASRIPDKAAARLAEETARNLEEED